MKKLVVLALLLAATMLSAQAAATFWSDPHRMDLGVTLDYMWAQDFGPGKEFSDRPILELKFNWMANEFTTVYVELEEGPLASQGDTAGGTSGAQGGLRNVYSTTADAGYDVKIVGLDRAVFTTDVAKALKLPVGLTVMYGLYEFNGRDNIRVTKSEFEDWLGEADIRNWGAQVEVMPSPMVTLRSAWAWNPGATTDPAQGQFLVGAYGTVAPISYEVTYDTHAMGWDKGWIEGGVKAAQDMTPDVNVAVMAAFEWDMATGKDYEAAGLTDLDLVAYGWKPVNVAGPTDTPDILYGPTSYYMIQAGLQVMFQKMAALGVSYRGAEAMLTGAVQVQGYFTPKAGDPLEAFIQVGLGLDSDVFDSAFDSLEAALRYTMGGVQWYLGFFYNAEFGRGIAKEWADFDLAAVPFGETSAIFMRGKISL